MHQAKTRIVLGRCYKKPQQMIYIGRECDNKLSTENTENTENFIYLKLYLQYVRKVDRYNKKIQKCYHKIVPRYSIKKNKYV